MALSIDRKAVVDTLSQGRGDIGGVLQPPPAGLWGMPSEQIAKLAGYDPDVNKKRDQARQIMQQLGYGPDNRLAIKVTTRDWSIYRDPAVLLIDQLKQVYIDGELDVVDTGQYFPKLQRKDFAVALNFQTAGPDPDPIIHLFYGCGSGLNWDGYCNPEVDKMISSSRARPTPAAASNCCGRSSASWPRTTPGRSSITAPAGPACSLTSRG
jgi:peptide/nickel transport system substrate-binding protein